MTSRPADLEDGHCTGCGFTFYPGWVHTSDDMVDRCDECVLALQPELGEPDHDDPPPSVFWPDYPPLTPEEEEEAAA